MAIQDIGHEGNISILSSYILDLKSLVNNTPYTQIIQIYVYTFLTDLTATKGGIVIVAI